MKKGICMLCGKIFKDATRALVDGQFSEHNEEKHRRKLDSGVMLVLKYFNGEAPKVEVKRERKVKAKSEVRKKVREAEEVAEWV